MTAARRLAVALASLLLAGVATLGLSSPAQADSVQEIQAQLSRYAQEQADIDRQFAEVQQRLENTERQVTQIEAEQAAHQAKIDQMRGQVAQVALANWQSQGIDQTMVLLMADDVPRMLGQLATTQWVTTMTVDLLQKYQVEQADLAESQRSLEASLEQIRLDNDRLAELGRLANERVRATQRLLSRLGGSTGSAEAVRPAANVYDLSGLEPSSSLIKPLNAAITSPYGMRLHPITRQYKLHDGTDYGAPCGTPLVAPANGVVTQEGYVGGYGYRLFIDHGTINGQRVTSSFNHLSSYAVPEGATVAQGQVVAYVGATGQATGCHLHLMLWIDDVMVNPATVI
ncbi:MAG: peptidoglycan DD-metalloendopeptidase family protein [Propionibacteriaceae bacterium]|jgi:murein DD-endopeptidase MepM/ murein hydrolase activator NlpD|nr:peptidoglycan DD-metalloendopeptidase family protein [Propionibacteriaceae bacterium]